MASVSPYLRLLLRPKQRPDIPYDDPNDLIDEPSQPMDERGARIASTIPIRPRYRDVPSNTLSDSDPRVYSVPTGNGKYGERVIEPGSGRILGLGTQQDYEPLASQPGAPLASRVADLGEPPAPPILYKPSIPLSKRDVIAEDRDRLLAAQNKPHSKAKAVLEGLGTWAAGGLGIPLHRMLHPGGTEVEKAQRQLATDLALRKEDIDTQDAGATIKLRTAQARKIDADIQAAIDHPDTSDADKAKLETAQAILRSHPQPFDPNDPQDVVAIKKLNDAGIPIPQSYGKQPKEATPLFREVKQSDGSVLTKKSVDGGKTWTVEPDLTSAAPPTAPNPADVNKPDIESLTQRIANNQKELLQHQKEISVKHGAWTKQSETDYQEATKEYNAAIAAGDKPARPQRKDFFEKAKANDPDFLAGNYEDVNNRIKELNDSIKQDQRDLEGLQRESRKGLTTPRRGTKGLSRGVFRQNNPEATKGKTDAQIDAMIRGGGLIPIP